MFRIHCHHSNNIMLRYVGLGMASLCIISCMHARMHVCAHLHYMYIICMYVNHLGLSLHDLASAEYIHM